MKATTIKKYLLDTYGECRHDAVKVAKALRHVSKYYDVDKKDLFHLVFENKPIEGRYTHSYGFNTGNGRVLIDAFTHAYYTL